MEDKKKSSKHKDPRLASTDQPKFCKSASDVLDMFEDKTMASHPLSTRSGKMEGTHGLAGPTVVESGRADPLKEELRKLEDVSFGGGHKMQKKPDSYKEHKDKLSEVYEQYMNVDSPSSKKKPKKR